MSEKLSQKKGITYAFIAYLLWGLLPIYWKAVQMVPPIQILAHRIIWSFVLVALLLFIKRQWSRTRVVLQNKSKIVGLVLSSLLITANWFIYIWAVNNNRVVEASLGYYINPLFTVLLGIIVLHERMDLWEVISLIFAAIGVLVLAIEYGQIPWISLGLAATFGLYSLAKRLVEVDSLLGLALETVVMVPVSLVYLTLVQANGDGVLGHISFLTLLLLMGTGIATAIPLLSFAEAAKSIPFSMIGFIQYISPTISLLLGVFLFKEEFTRTHLISFGVIWIALIIFSLSRIALNRKKSINKAEAAAK